MIYSIYPIKDATIYSELDTMNTGIDQVLELRKQINGSEISNSRILMKFDISEIINDVSLNKIPGTAKFYLNMNSVDARELNASYDIYAFAVSQSWDMGLGKLIHEPITTNGVSWKYRHSTEVWISGSNAQGGTYFTSSFATQSFDYEMADVRLDVSNIVRQWISGSIPNEGFIVKYSDIDEQSSRTFGNIQYYALESHTIYTPKLEVVWDDSQFNTGSLSALTDEDIVLYVRNLKESYTDGSKVKIRVFGRPRYAPRTFSTQSAYLDVKYLPETTYYAVQDSVTAEYIVPFDDNATKLSCDEKGNYFNLWMSSFHPERYYKIVFRVDTDSTSEYYDENVYFKVVR